MQQREANKHASETKGEREHRLVALRVQMAVSARHGPGEASSVL